MASKHDRIRGIVISVTAAIRQRVQVESVVLCLTPLIAFHKSENYDHLGWEVVKK